jgi:ankyrin repeat protein
MRKEKSKRHDTSEQFSMTELLSAKDINENTALHLVAYTNNSSMAKVLLDNGADLSIQN